MKKLGRATFNRTIRYKKNTITDKQATRAGTTIFYELKTIVPSFYVNLQLD